MQDALVVCNLDVVVPLVLIVKGDVGHVLFYVGELGTCKLERLLVVVDVDVVIHLVGVEIFAVYVGTSYIERQGDGGRRVVVAWNSRAVVQRWIFGFAGLLLVWREH